MKLPVDIRFIGVAPSEALEAAARERIARIEHQCTDLMGWRVASEQPHRHRQQGREFAVRIDVSLAGHELAVERVGVRTAERHRDALRAGRRRQQEGPEDAQEPGIRQQSDRRIPSVLWRRAA